MGQTHNGSSLTFPCAYISAVDTGCPLEFGNLDFKEVISACFGPDRGRCCRFVNAVVAISMSRYTNATSQLAIPSSSSEKCLKAISTTLQTNGLPSNATAFCGLGSKIATNFHCKGRTNIEEMESTPRFQEVQLKCVKPLSSSAENCRECLNASITFLRNLGGTEDNMTFSICRDATFVTIASYGDSDFANDKASCFFNVTGLEHKPVLTWKPPASAPSASASSSPRPNPAHSPTSDHSSVAIIKKTHSSSHLAVILGVGIGVTIASLSLSLLLIILIDRKRKELKKSKDTNPSHWNKTLALNTCDKLHDWRNGPSSNFKRFSRKEIRKATDDFSTIIGRGGFGTVYKARFNDGLVAAVKRMNTIAQQDEFCKEMELLGRLHHRHLVTLVGFCAERHERFLIYEYMENGSLKEHLHAPTKAPLSWRIRLQIVIDVAAALEYLHFYCDPPLCHRDIKSSNILLDENFVAKVSDFGLAHASRSGASKFEPINTDVRGTPGYMDPEYLVTQELTEKSDVYSYGVLLLEIITARPAVEENKNLVEWAQKFILEDSNLSRMVDPNLENIYDYEELQCLVNIVRMCTQREGKSRPSIRHVLQLLYDRLDITCPNSALIALDEDEDKDDESKAIHRNKRKIQIEPFTDGNDFSGEVRCMDSSPNTSQSYCSKSFLLDCTSPGSQ
ncbi:probable receptor-like protein kinase At1g49730 isoform X3 [Cryptomeria japonica]|uniref:probable receptor-like protein kinase At1g49730 isoform X3 n=1 Tax=Cryptomeria japonica TaxID=3369 RepID=UPI0025ABA2F9|nr:probable receptor-like protein kinase At1g49730 isoform X3 [Cryptomeria japonica]